MRISQIVGHSRKETVNKEYASITYSPSPPRADSEDEGTAAPDQNEEITEHTGPKRGGAGDAITGGVARMLDPDITNDRLRGSADLAPASVEPHRPNRDSSAAGGTDELCLRR